MCVLTLAARQKKKKKKKHCLPSQQNGEVSQDRVSECQSGDEICAESPTSSERSRFSVVQVDTELKNTKNILF